MAAIAHIFILGTLIAIFMNLEPKNRFSGFYIKQAFGLTLFFLALGSMASNFDTWLISAPFYFCFISLWTYSFIGAVTGEIKPLPKIGVYFQNGLTNYQLNYGYITFNFILNSRA